MRTFTFIAKDANTSTKKAKGFCARHIKQYPLPLWLGKESDWVWLSVIVSRVSWWLEKLFVWLELILHVWTLLCFYINRVSQSYAKRTSEAPKRGLANSLAGHTLLPAWRIVWKKWMSIGKKKQKMARLLRCTALYFVRSKILDFHCLVRSRNSPIVRLEKLSLVLA